MLAVTFIQDIVWAPAAVGLRWLVFVFDWDRVQISDNVMASLPSELIMCTQFFPCSLQVRGAGRGAMTVSGNGQILCLLSSGCMQIVIQSVAVACSNNSLSAVKIQGSVLVMSNTLLKDCHSDSDGGVIQAYDVAQVVIEGCRFINTQSDGFGGAIAAYGSNLSISDTWFHNCSARSGGGAIWISAFQFCYGSNQTQNTHLLISSSIFTDCYTFGAGGAVLADSAAMLGREVLEVAISYSNFSVCSSITEGGALRIAGALVKAQVQSSDFESCVSDASGGAISSSSSSSLTLKACSIHHNTALGLGGGALHLNQSNFSAQSTLIHDNSAPWGGGGVLLWQGQVTPAAMECPEGTITSVASCAFGAADPAACLIGICIACSAGLSPGENGQPGCSTIASNASTSWDLQSEFAMRSLCGVNNSALFGQCIASDCKKLLVSEIAGSVYTGVSFNFTVTKKDAYGNTIVSDSSTVLDTVPSNGKLEDADPRTSIVGSTLSIMRNGVALLQFAVKVTFSQIDYVKQSSSLFAPIFLYVRGIDAESGMAITSSLVPLKVQQGAKVCPEGFILVPDNFVGFNGSAVCTVCKPGSYSISPLAIIPGSHVQYPSCLSCPQGCDCTAGGADITCKPGLWQAVGGIYRLVSCPAGYELINSSAGTSHGDFSSNMQQCKGCLSGQYIINPDTDTCQECPPGGKHISEHLLSVSLWVSEYPCPSI